MPMNHQPRSAQESVDNVSVMKEYEYFVHVQIRYVSIYAHSKKVLH